MEKKSLLFKPEGMTFDFLDESAIQAGLLESFSVAFEWQLIEVSTDEFSAVCPGSGLPDIARVEIKYFPRRGKAVELKSLKYYFMSYRNVGLFQEHVTERIYQDLSELLDLGEEDLEVRTIYNTRGGIDTVCTIGELSR